LSRRSFLHSLVVLGTIAGSTEMTSRIGVLEQQPSDSGMDAVTHLPLPGWMEQERFRLRVVSLNVWALPILAKDTPARMTAIVRRLAELDADIVGLQEVWQEESQERIIAAARTASDLQHHHYFKAGIRESGLLVLSRFPIRKVAFHRFRLTGRPERLVDAEYFAGKGIGYAQVQTPVGEVDVYNTHLIALLTTDEQDPYRAHRTAAAYEAVKFVAGQSGGRTPVLLLGDLNMSPDQLGYKIVSCIGRFRDSHVSANPGNPGHTRSGLNPYTPNEDSERIDYIFTKDGATLGVRAVDSQVIMDEPPPVVGDTALPAYSDHYGVLSEIELVAATSPGDAVEQGCDPASTIWTSVQSYIDAALQNARSRQSRHYAKGLGGAVVAPGLFLFGRVLKSPTSAVHASPTDAAVAGTGRISDHDGDVPGGTGSRHRRPLPRRVFLTRLVQTMAIVVMTPYALLHGWLGVVIVPDEIQELEALRHEVLHQMESSNGVH